MAVKAAPQAERQPSASSRRAERAPLRPRSLPAHDLQTLAMHLSPSGHPKNIEAVLSLQRTVGNAAVQRLLRARAAVNRAAHASKREADASRAPEPADATVLHRAPAAAPRDIPPVTAAQENSERVAESLQQPQAAPIGEEALQHRVQRQASMGISSPRDPSEREAEATARRVIRMPDSAIASAPVLRKPGRVVPQRQAGGHSISARGSAEITASMGGGAPLPLPVRQFMEPRFGADFGAVQIHTGPDAARLSTQMSAQAFTVGPHVYFGRGRFQPATDEGRELIAHELTHTIQQGAVRQGAGEAGIQRRAEVTVSEASPIKVQRLGVDDALNFFSEQANLIPGFRMLTIVLGLNPINMSRVDRSAANTLRALVEFMPAGGLIVQALDTYGVFDRAGAWVEQQIAALGMTGGAIRQALMDFLGSLDLSDILNPEGVWERAKHIFTAPIERIISFAKGLADSIVGFIKDAILLPLAKLAEGTLGWDLLIAVLGRNPITGDAVPRTTDTLIGGFMKLIGQEEVWNNLKQANAVERAFAWFQSALAGLVGFVSQIPSLFVAALHTLTIADIVVLPNAFAKVAAAFGDFVGRFIAWAGTAVWNLLEIIFEVVSPGALAYVKKTGAALKSILKDPLPFVRNLVAGAKLGFQNFADNVGTHLKAGLIDLLTGSLPGVYIPKALSLVELGRFALSVLGITWGQIRGKIVKALGPQGETIMKGLETGFDIVVALVRGGPAAAWELIKDKLTNLRDMVIEGIIGFVTETIVKKAIPKLIAMFIPGAGFISAILSIYDTVKVFVEKLARIAQVVAAFVDSIVAIAAGQIAGAAKRIESTLAGLVSLAISFLAGFLGLGDIASKIMGVIEKVRAIVDRALDTTINWIVTKAKTLFAQLFGKDAKDGRTEAQKESAVAAAQTEAEHLLNDPTVTVAKVKIRLPAIKSKYQLTRVDLEQTGDEYAIIVVINPQRSTRKKKFDPMDLAIGDVVRGLYKDPMWLDTSKEQWIPGTVTSLDRESGVFGWKSANLEISRQGKFRLADYDKTWKKGHISQVKIPDDEIIEQNKKQSWTSIDTARVVLNYRHHKAQFNVPGTQWEHIIEQSAGGAHSSGNLALTASPLNNRLGQLFGKAYASYDAPKGLPGTGDLSLREYLSGKSLFIQNRWKEHFYTQLNVGLKWSSSERGIWRELS